MKTKLLALVLRGSSMGAKFLLVIGLSKTLTTADYGVFSLIITSLTFLIFFLGLDFYNFSHREIIDNDDTKIQLIVNQFWFHLLAYIVYFPIIYLIFLIDIIPMEYLIPFYILLILEHIGQELFRFFNLFNKHNQANLSLFIRTALWIVVMVLVEYIYLKKDITIINIIYYWIGGSALSIVYSLFYLVFKTKISYKSVNFFSIDRKWIKKGIKISIPFFLGTIAYKVIEYSDRYMIDWFLDKESVGIYSFYTNFANIINIVVNTVTITLLVPNLLRAVTSGDSESIKIKTAGFSKELYLTTIIVAIVIVVLIFPTLNWLDKEEFSTELNIYFIILASNVVFNVSLLYHFLLYAYKKDSLIFKPTIYASLINVILNFIFIPKFGLIAAAASTFVSFAVILLLKRKYWSRIKPI